MQVLCIHACLYIQVLPQDAVESYRPPDPALFPVTIENIGELSVGVVGTTCRCVYVFVPVCVPAVVYCIHIDART